MSMGNSLTRGAEHSTTARFMRYMLKHSKPV
jgi:hypothetical protein